MQSMAFGDIYAHLHALRALVEPLRQADVVLVREELTC